MSVSISDTLDRGRKLFAGDPIRAILLVVLVVLLLDLVRQLAVGQTQLSEFGVMLKDGLMRGLFFGLAGIGLSMTYSILNFANFSHGDLITSGSFAGMAVTYIIAGGFGAATEEGSIIPLALVGTGGSVYGANLGIGVASTPLAVFAGVIFAGLATIALALFIDRPMPASPKNSPRIRPSFSMTPNSENCVCPTNNCRTRSSMSSTSTTVSIARIGSATNSFRPRSSRSLILTDIVCFLSSKRITSSSSLRLFEGVLSDVA